MVGICNVRWRLPILDSLGFVLGLGEILSATKAFCWMMGFTSNSRTFCLICSVQYVAPLKALPIVIFNHKIGFKC